MAQRMGQGTEGLMTGALLGTFVLVVSRGLRHDKTRNSPWGEMKQKKKNPPKQARKLQTYTIINNHV